MLDFDRFEVVTFDCYGTLIDWESGILSVEALGVLKRSYRLAVVSNVDDDLLEGSARLLQTEFDRVVTAQQVRAYKPSLRMFAAAIEQIALPRETILHVAQSLFHDIVPAKTLGLSTVWVNRRGGKEGFGATPAAHAEPDLEAPDLRTLVSQMGLS